MKILAISFACFFLTAVFSAEHEIVTQNDEKKPTVIRVLSYNIHHANPPSQADVIDLDAIAAVIKKQKPDIVALQEIDVHTERSGPYNQAEELGKRTDMNVYFAKAIDYDGGAYGVAVLSRFPIQKKQKHPLPSNPETGGEPRILATVDVKLPNGRLLTFACTHLDAQKNPENRHMQIRKIVDILQKSSNPVILAGDFNDTIGTETIRVLDENFKRTCDNCEPTSPASNPIKAIDFIAFKPANKFKVLQHQSVEEGYASDHTPVFSIIKLKLPM